MEKIEGTIRTITYYNEENGFAILKVEMKHSADQASLFSGTKETMTVKGYLPTPIKGETYRFFGKYETHEQYGEQFAFDKYEKLEDFNEEGLIDYLSSELFTGVGEKTAERIVNTLGKDAIHKITTDPAVLNKVPKLTKTVKTTLKDQLLEHKASEQTLIKLYDYGLSPKLAKRIVDVYKDETLAIIQANPYQMIEDITGIGFDRADFIAKKLGISDNDPRRIKATVIYFLTHLAYQKGHTHIKKDQFISLLLRQLNKTADLTSEDDVQTIITGFKKKGTIFEEQGKLVLASLSKQETALADRIKQATKTVSDIDHKALQEAIETFETRESIQYDALQKTAIKQALRHKLMILTGGPGTGKTTVIKGIIHAFRTLNKIKDENIKLIAPTGRAAKRMSEATGVTSSTIHKFLGYGFDGLFMYDEHQKQTGDLFLIDESSMIDITLADHLMRALPDDAHVIFVGDEEQLPSVGPGQVLKDLIASQTIETITLQKIHRQSENSNIIHLAASIRKGVVPGDLYERYPDRYVLRERPENFKQRLKRMIDYLMKNDYDLQDDIQVLIPMYKSDIGIDAVNAFLQETYNPYKDKHLKYGDKCYYLNDKVLQLQNRAEDGIMNGDQGRITGLDGDNGTLVVDFFGTEVTYQKQDLDQITLAYAMSVHKAQGSEYRVVILPLFKQYAILLKRRLIYTAISRAKEKLIIAGDIEYLSYAVRQIEENRSTMLKEKLQGQVLDRESQIDASLKQMAASGSFIAEHTIDDPRIPFDTLGEELDGKTPYDFMTDETV